MYICYQQEHSKMPETIPINWDYIVDKIIEERCLLVLGPGIYSSPGAIDIQQQLVNYLDIPNNSHIKRYYENEHFFLFDEPYKRTLTCHSIKKFYTEKEPNDTLRKITEIPFNAVLTLTPDKLLPKAFGNRFPYQFGYYKKDKTPQSIKLPTKTLPLVYNLFGCIDNEESIILSHNDLYDYFKSIFAHQSMPTQLSTLLQEVKNIIFLGIPFDRWYLQLLLRELKIHNPRYEFTRFAADQELIEENNDLKTFCYEQFRINFSNKNAADFIDHLYDFMAQKDMLRKEGEVKLSPTDQVKQYVRQGELEDAIDALLDYIEKIGDTEFVDTASILSSRYNRFRKKVIKGILENREIATQEAQFIDSILELTNKVEAL